MFKKTINFENFDGDQCSQDFYFHMSKAELLEMAADGKSMMERLQRIIDANDGRAIISEFTSIIRAAAGVRSEDGARFIKTDLAKSALMDSPAFDELLMELATDAEAATAFIKQLIPEKMQKEMMDQIKKQKEASPPVPDPFAEGIPDNRPAWMKEHRNPTDTELMNMSHAEFLLFQKRQP